jgi:hypothetical protein
MNDDQPRQVFYEIYADIPREGPGDSDSTKRAFSMLAELLSALCPRHHPPT